MGSHVVDDKNREDKASTAELEKVLNILRYELEKAQALTERLRALAKRAQEAKEKD